MKIQKYKILNQFNYKKKTFTKIIQFHSAK